MTDDDLAYLNSLLERLTNLKKTFYYFSTCFSEARQERGVEIFGFLAAGF